MTLLLTSAGMQVKDEIFKILPKPADQFKLAHIITASKPEKDTSYVFEDRAEMMAAGFQVEDIDVEGKNENQLWDLLRDKDAIVVQGGNTFYLMKCVRESGFEKVVKELIAQGKIYIGVSAGSVIAGVNIEVASLGDENTVNLKDLTGMSLVSFAITPHANNKEIADLKKIQSKANYKIRAITNDQAFLVKDEIVALVGKGEEIII